MSAEPSPEVMDAVHAVLSEVWEAYVLDLAAKAEAEAKAPEAPDYAGRRVVDRRASSASACPRR